MKKSYIITFHILYWLPSVIGLLTYVYILEATSGVSKSTAVYNIYISNFILSLFSLLSSSLTFYFFYIYFFPRYFVTQNLKQCLIIGLVVIMFMALLCTGFTRIIYDHFPNNLTNYYKTGVWQVLPFLTQFLKIATVAITACMLKGFINWYNDISYKKELEKKNIQTELALLKAQINPHFLFNTLNNIDVLIEKDAASASVYLKKLSDLLRYTLYESPAETIPLANEIAGITTYLELQKIRTANQKFIKFEMNGHADGLFIAPMIFIPFIENAFKHSTNKKVDNAIEIGINISGNVVNFSCVNVFDESTALKQPDSGLGLDLISNRLNLFYRDSHQLKIDKTDNKFSVHLMIRANDN